MNKVIFISKLSLLACFWLTCLCPSQTVAETIYFRSAPEAVNVFEDPKPGMSYYACCSDALVSVLAIPSHVSLKGKYWEPIEPGKLDGIIKEMKSQNPGLQAQTGSGSKSFCLGNPPSYFDISGDKAKGYKAKASGGGGRGSSGGGQGRSGGSGP